MLAYKAKRMIMDILTTALIDHRLALLESYKTNLTELDKIKKIDAELLFSKINRDYYNSIAEVVIENVNRVTSEVSQILEEARRNPSLYWRGYDFSTTSFSADKVFALCFYALTGKTAAKRHLIAARQLQSFSMQDALRQAYSEREPNSQETSM